MEHPKVSEMPLLKPDAKADSFLVVCRPSCFHLYVCCTLFNKQKNNVLCFCFTPTQTFFPSFLRKLGGNYCYPFPTWQSKGAFYVVNNLKYILKYSFLASKQRFLEDLVTPDTLKSEESSHWRGKSHTRLHVVESNNGGVNANRPHFKPRGSPFLLAIHML